MRRFHQALLRDGHRLPPARKRHRPGRAGGVPAAARAALHRIRDRRGLNRVVLQAGPETAHVRRAEARGARQDRVPMEGEIRRPPNVPGGPGRFEAAVRGVVLHGRQHDLDLRAARQQLGLHGGKIPGQKPGSEARHSETRLRVDESRGLARRPPGLGLHQQLPLRAPRVRSLHPPLPQQGKHRSAAIDRPCARQTWGQPIGREGLGVRLHGEGPRGHGTRLARRFRHGVARSGARKARGG
mmetsp:Transcript_45222/g.107833  ORF Transcript_45222/g.107833 Transcript_45222/m.107833 type:complete len:241 (-) Transcript_45222:151-873(-)